MPGLEFGDHRMSFLVHIFYPKLLWFYWLDSRTPMLKGKKCCLIYAEDIIMDLQLLCIMYALISCLDMKTAAELSFPWPSPWYLLAFNNMPKPFINQQIQCMLFPTCWPRNPYLKHHKSTNCLNLDTNMAPYQKGYSIILLCSTCSFDH